MDTITTKPMRSRAQWRYLFARGMPFARRWAHETPGGTGTRYRNLPAKKKAQATFGGTKRSDLDADVFAGPDRSFPIVTAQDVRDAVRSLGRTTHDKAAVKRGIIRRARAIGAMDALPERWREKAGQADGTAFLVFKDARGDDRWISVTTTAYKDRDGEWISRKAIADAVAQGDATGQRGVLRYWHVPGLDFGDCDYQATAQDGRFLIESGTCRSPRHAAVVRKAASLGYQMSPGFLHPMAEPAGAIFDHIAIFERSFVPPGRASNVLTWLTAKGVRMLTDEKRKALEDLAGDPELLRALLAHVQATDKAAQDQGMTYKETAETDATVPAPPDEITIGGVAYTLKAPFPPPADAGESADERTDAAAPDAVPADETADDGMDDMQFVDALAQRLLDALAPLFAELKGALNFETKMRGMMDELKSGWAGGMAQKDAAIADVAAAVTAVDARLKTLEGDQPAAVRGYRATADPATILTIDAETLKAIAPGAPNDPFADIREFMVGVPAQ